MRTVAVIATGGTIASNAAATGGPVNAGVAAYVLLDSLHERPEGIDLKVEDFEVKGSYALDLPTVHRLCGRIDALLADPTIDGIVVTHGTDTMEETAYLADLIVKSDKPVIFTGAQRHAGMPDTDGPRNIADAIRCAVSPDLIGQGAAILFEGEIHAAREVTKTHTSRVDTFRSAGLGKIGEVDAGNVYVYRRRAFREVLSVDHIDEGVEMLLLGLGTSPALLDYCQTLRRSGVVLAAFGRGNAPQGFAVSIQRLTEAGIPVVIASRCAEGRVLPVYGKDSGGRTLIDAGGIFCGSLQPVKARLLLSVLLADGVDIPTIREAFQKHI
ncbi:asparaginase [Loktanella salsilacus]|uniref:asparaginase n=1 Tax=Loktanella salsilacus TaxID=195913 RepID=UPI0020B8B2AC|nr:asparaginase [Loktanella salsilacus]UTH45286.1 asparaginase [Loktanella salsilacus]